MPVPEPKTNTRARGHLRWRRALDVACSAAACASLGAGTAGNGALATYFMSCAILFAVFALRFHRARAEPAQVRLDVGCLTCAKRADVEMEVASA